MKDNWIIDELDVDGDCPVQVILDTFAKHDIHIVDYTPQGPAGGNPMFTIQATKANIDNLNKEIQA